MTNISTEPTATAPVADLNVAQLLSALRRRARGMALAFTAVLGVAVLAAVLWPPTYRSTGTILIEQQEVPTEVVRSAVTSYADERVQVISQRVMTSANLLRIIDKYQLYGDARDTSTREALTDRMRRDIHLQMISAEVMDPRQGRATKATIAFSVGFDSRTAETAARVANELTTLYLSENIESRKQLAEGTADFLRDEAERLGKSVAELDAKMAAFKEKNGERLPEYTQFNLQAADRAQQELRDLDSRVRSLDQQIVYLDAQLAQVDPVGASYGENGERVLTPRDRLRVLRAQLASARAEFTDKHPDILRYQREIEALEKELGSGADPDQDARGPDNPAFIQLRSQKNAALTERSSLIAQAQQVRAHLAQVQSNQALAPDVEREYSALERDLQSEQAKYAETRQKQMEAQLVQNLETERKGERFTLIEPALQPMHPVSPHRALVLALGLVLAIASALATMFVLERVDTSIRDRNHLLQLVGVPPLAVIPRVELEEERLARRRTQRRLVTAGVAAMALALVMVHLFVRPLDVLWFTLARRLG